MGGPPAVRASNRKARKGREGIRKDANMWGTRQRSHPVAPKAVATRVGQPSNLMKLKGGVTPKLGAKSKKLLTLQHSNDVSSFII
jgi:hypothetical protein